MTLADQVHRAWQTTVAAYDLSDGDLDMLQDWNYEHGKQVALDWVLSQASAPAEDGRTAP